MSGSYATFKRALCRVAAFPHLPQHCTSANVAASVDVLEAEVLPALERVPKEHLSGPMAVFAARLQLLKYVRGGRGGSVRTRSGHARFII